MKFCCKPRFQLWVQKKCEKLLLTPSTSNGHFHCAEKASKQASLLLPEYLFDGLLAQKHVARRKDLHQMSLLACYLQSRLKQMPFCSAAWLHMLQAWNFQTLSFALTAWKISRKSNDHLLAPKSSLDDIQVNILLISTIVLAICLVCSLLGKKKQTHNLLPNYPLKQTCVRWDQTFFHPNTYFFDTHYTTVRNRIFPIHTSISRRKRLLQLKTKSKATLRLYFSTAIVLWAYSIWFGKEACQSRKCNSSERLNVTDTSTWKEYREREIVTASLMFFKKWGCSPLKIYHHLQEGVKK